MSRRRKDCNRSKIGSKIGSLIRSRNGSKIGSKIGSKKGLEDPEPVSTAINEANGANKTSYDLQGRKGVVIIDGKLVLKK